MLELDYCDRCSCVFVHVGHADDVVVTTLLTSVCRRAQCCPSCSEARRPKGRLSRVLTGSRGQARG